MIFTQSELCSLRLRASIAKMINLNCSDAVKPTQAVPGPSHPYSDFGPGRNISVTCQHALVAGYRDEARKMLTLAQCYRKFGTMAFIFIVTLLTSMAQTIVTNGNFDSPAIEPTTHYYHPQGGGWIFTNGGVISVPGNCPPYSFNATPSPTGGQLAFLQIAIDATNESSMSQPIVLPLDGVFELTYWEAGRANNGGCVPYDIYLDAALIVRDLMTETAQPWMRRVFRFTASKGQHVLMIQTKRTPGDNTAFFDDISISPVGEAITSSIIRAALYPGVTIEGLPGKSYTLEFADTLPTTKWTVLTNVTLPNSPFIVFDTTHPLPKSRVYRTVWSKEK